MSNYLCKSIISSLLILGAAVSYSSPASADPVLPPVNVNGRDYWIPMDPYSRCDNPQDNSCMGDNEGPIYDGDPGYGDGGGDYDFDEDQLQVCTELTGKGLPINCTRELAGAHTPIPMLNIPSPLQLLLQYAPGRDAAAQREAIAQLNLSACYADVSIPPSECESRYVLAVRDLWSGMSLSSQFQGYLNDAVQNLSNRFVNTESDRRWAGFFTSTSIGYSFYDIGFDVGPMAAWAFNNGQYNNALVKAREQKLCELWYRLWDSYDCSSL